MSEGTKIKIKCQTLTGTINSTISQVDYSCCRLFRQYLLLLFLNQMASALFRLIAAAGRNIVVANTFGSFALLLLFVLGGFVLSRGIQSKNVFSNMIFFLEV